MAVNKTQPVIKEKDVSIQGIRKEDKIAYVTDLRKGASGYAELFVNECIAQASSPDHCIKYGSSIALHESCAGTCGGAFLGVIVDARDEKGNRRPIAWQITRWVQRYNKNEWFKRETPSNRIQGKYCTEENDGTPGCPHWKIRVGQLVAMYDKKF